MTNLTSQNPESLTQNSKLRSHLSVQTTGKTQNYLEDFWSRQSNAQTHTFTLAPLGWPATITANEPGVLAAARLSAGRYSQAEESGEPALRLQVVVRPGPGGPLPADLVERLAYTGVGPWITLSAGEWGHGFANLASGEAVVVLSAALAGDTRLVSRFFIDHYLLNFILTGWTMLHASGILDPARQRLVLLVAPHNTGKSTTALRLLRAGYTFLADGMALLRRDGPGFVVGGYPVGEVKLRDDVLALFPEYTGQAVRVREQRKTVVDLRASHPDRLATTLLRPTSICLCLVDRSSSPHTTVRPLDPAGVLPWLAGNTVYWDEAGRLAPQLKTLQALAAAATPVRLAIGSDPDSLLAEIGKLF